MKKLLRCHFLINVFHKKIYNPKLKPIIENISSTLIIILISDFDYYLNVNWKELNNRLLKPEWKSDNNYNDYFIHIENEIHMKKPFKK